MWNIEPQLILHIGMKEIVLDPLLPSCSKHGESDVGAKLDTIWAPTLQRIVHKLVCR